MEDDLLTGAAVGARYQEKDALQGIKKDLLLGGAAGLTGAEASSARAAPNCDVKTGFGINILFTDCVLLPSNDYSSKRVRCETPARWM